jgi:hypothetical protein
MIKMIWIYRALAVTALLTRVIVIYENYEKFRDRRHIRKRQKKQENVGKEQEKKDESSPRRNRKNSSRI